MVLIHTDNFNFTFIDCKNIIVWCLWVATHAITSKIVNYDSSDSSYTLTYLVIFSNLNISI